MRNFFFDVNKSVKNVIVNSFNQLVLIKDVKRDEFLNIIKFSSNIRV